jgi:hypothetical protein
LFVCFKQNEIDIQKQFSTLLLTYKQLEEKLQRNSYKQRERERERESILAQKNTILIQKLNQRQEIFDDLIRQKDLELERKNQKIVDLTQTILTFQDQINNHFCSFPHNCPPCSLIHLPEPHECPIIINCPHSDYQGIKEQKDSYQEQLTTEEELVNIKDKRIDNLTETITKLNSKNNSKQKQIIQLVQQLRVIQKLETKNGALTKLINKLEKKAKKLERIQSNKKHNRQRINSLNQKLKNLTNEQIKSERDHLKTKLEIYTRPTNSCSEAYHNEIRLEREKELITQIIPELELTLPKNSSLGEVIQEIKKLIQKPGQGILVEVGEKIEMIRNLDLHSLEKELGIELSSEIKAQIEQATNYQELSNIRNQAIKSYLEKGQNTRIITQPSKEITKPIEKERIIWISLLVISLMVIGGLVVRLRKSSGKRSLS